jgi:hypothetical protein
MAKLVGSSGCFFVFALQEQLSDWRKLPDAKGGYYDEFRLENLVWHHFQVLAITILTWLQNPYY